MSNQASAPAVNTDNIISGSFMTTAGAAGVSLNIYVMVLLTKSPLFHNAFGFICFSQLIADSGLLLIYLFWLRPATLFSYDLSITKSLIGTLLGQLIHFFWFATLYCHLQIAINRLSAVAWPFAYNRIFAHRSLVYFISAGWILAFAHSSTYFWPDCWIWFDVNILSWTVGDTNCARIINQNVNYFHTLIMCAIIILINTITFYYLRGQMKVLQKTGGTHIAQQISKMKKNTHFYMQGCISAAVVVIATILFRIVPLFKFTKFELAIINSVNWELIATSNGFILLLFNKSLRNVKRHQHIVVSVTNH